jgi:LmbE family N-acetylglucosaminyl deacetylase
MPHPPLKLLILGAHPDDAEYHAGGLAAIYRELGHVVRMISVTDGGAGHHELQGQQLIDLRRQEAAAAGRVIGAEYLTWEFPDGSLEASLEVRQRIIGEIRTFAPDLLLTHRTCDYHPDHRAVGQAVQDASYLVTVPSVVPEIPFLKYDPVVAYMPDPFKKPCPLEPQVIVDASAQLATIVEMLAQHESQVYQWLPFNEGHLDDVPGDASARREWLHDWFVRQAAWRLERFANEAVAAYGDARWQGMTHIEAY